MIAEPTRVAIYARCSSQGQADKDLSIPAQLDAARERARREGWDVVKEFVDEAETARTADRPSFQQMIADSRRKPRPFDQILVWKFSRFARNREDSVIYKRLLEKHGIRLISLNEPVDDSPAGKMLEGILEVLDEFYSANLAEDTVRGMRHNAAQGFHNGGASPVGYRVRRTGSASSPRGVYEPEPVFAPVVQRCFRMVLAGEGAATIASTLNEEGVLPPQGRLWTKQRVLYMLRNETYLGIRRWGLKGTSRAGRNKPPVRVVDAHEALVSPEDFARVQVMMKARSMKVMHPRRLCSDYLLSGLLVCGYCGAPFIGHSAKSGQVHYYGCQTKMKSGAKACEARLLNRVQADDAVTEQLREVVLTEEHLTELVRMVNEELAARSEDAEGELQTVEGQLAAAQRKLGVLYKHIEEEKLTVEELRPRLRHWRARADELMARRRLLKERVHDCPQVAADGPIIRAYLAGLHDLLERGSVAERRAFLRGWIRRIEARGRELTIVYALPRWPGEDGGTGGGGEGRRGSVGGGRSNAGALERGAFGAHPGVLSMGKVGSPHLLRRRRPPSSLPGRTRSEAHGRPTGRPPSESGVNRVEPWEPATEAARRAVE